MLNTITLDEILFLDIETVPQAADFNALDAVSQTLWEEKSRYIRERKELALEESYAEAGIQAEFGKIICVGLGFFSQRMGESVFRVTTLHGSDEFKILQDLSNMLEERCPKPFRFLCAHNGKEFDFPYICRRMLVNGIALPPPLQIAGKKPWEINHLDTMELWKFGDYKHYTSVKLLAHIFGVPTPKDDISGADVRRVYYEENDIDRIAEYCKKDVVSMARIFQRYVGKSFVGDDAIIHV
ncbi:MAG: 3'-5' exonuclease [Flavobacteriales bacterium]